MSEPETESDRPRKMAQLGRRQYEGIGPVTNDGMPIILRSVKLRFPLLAWPIVYYISIYFLFKFTLQEVQEPHQHEWYKRLYQTIHKQKNGGNCCCHLINLNWSIVKYNNILLPLPLPFTNSQLPFSISPSKFLFIMLQFSACWTSSNHISKNTLFLSLIVFKTWKPYHNRLKSIHAFLKMFCKTQTPQTISWYATSVPEVIL